MRGVARAGAVALRGLTGYRVSVEAAVSTSLPGMALIGLPDTALAEARQRVRLACAQSGLKLSDRFITVNLSPAALPKTGSGFDLAIALAALAASGELPGPRLAETAHLGELALDGSLRRPAGLLGAVAAAKARGYARAMVPECALAEARLVEDFEVIAVAGLAEAARWHGATGPVPERAGPTPTLTPPATATPTPTAAGGSAGPRAPGAGEEGAAELADVLGQAEAVEALLVAAAGRHHLFLLGPPGSGKTMLAGRLPGILPPLSDAEALEASCIASLSRIDGIDRLLRLPPLESPHHTATATALIGGGSAGPILPGAVTRACHGVLFLDEAAEFAPSVLDALRQPLETGRVEVHRARGSASLPAVVQLVLAANPCPCGYAGVAGDERVCDCTPQSRRRYLGRLTGPLGDRIDLRVRLRRVSKTTPSDPAGSPPLTTREASARVLAARGRAADRLRGTPWRVNAELPGRWLRGPEHGLDRGSTAVLDQALRVGRLTLRGYDRTLRIAWTLADLGGRERPGRDEVARALLLRTGAPA